MRFSVERTEIVDGKPPSNTIQIRKVPTQNRIWNEKMELITVSIFGTVATRNLDL